MFEALHHINIHQVSDLVGGETSHLKNYVPMQFGSFSQQFSGCIKTIFETAT